MKPGVTEELPFGPDTLVFKVMGKVFAITGLEVFEFINLKCDPDRAVELREQYDSIRPGYHMNKRLWNSVYPEAGARLIKELIDHSYELIVASLPKKLQVELSDLEDSQSG
ncbi:MAG: MmcQ/YjbR family DNA-binding protein [Bacteroidota bacterium]